MKKIIKLPNPLKVIGITQLTFIILSVILYQLHLSDIIDISIYGSFAIFSPFLFNLPSIILSKRNDPDGIKWKDLNIISLINILISSIVTMVSIVVFETLDPDPIWLAFVLVFGIGMVVSTIISIFLEKGPVKQKIKRLISVILFVWAVYKIITNLLEGESDEDSLEGGIDTDGDGIADTFDTDGDGIADTSFIDTDGDGISDTLAIDTDGDGLIDTVYSDTDGDGRIDSFLKDVDGDGIADSGIIDTDGDGIPDKVV